MTLVDKCDENTSLAKIIVCSEKIIAA